jgi:hypothetical protein
MTGRTKRIVVLCHERDRRRMDRYVITHLAKIWQADGHDVVFSFGAVFVPGDLAILHVDLSVVPTPYLELARRYPRALNIDVPDIRKSVLSRDIVGRDDPWDGQVIVKTDLNFGGEPERKRTRRTRAWFARRHEHPAVPSAYRVFDRLHDVPDACFDDPRLVVERFLPERDGDLYVVRTCQVLGDHATWLRLASPQPIVNGRTYTACAPAPPHPEILARRRALGLDYGKLDFTVHRGETVLFDVNKTVGAGGFPETPALRETHRARARGLYVYFETPKGR